MFLEATANQDSLSHKPRKRLISSTWLALLDARRCAPLGTKSKSTEVYTSSASEMAVISETGFLKRYKAAGPDGLSPSSFKYGGQVLI